MVKVEVLEKVNIGGRDFTIRPASVMFYIRLTNVIMKWANESGRLLGISAKDAVDKAQEEIDEKRDIETILSSIGSLQEESIVELMAILVDPVPSEGSLDDVQQHIVSTGGPQFGDLVTLLNVRIETADLPELVGNLKRLLGNVSAVMDKLNLSEENAESQNGQLPSDES